MSKVEYRIKEYDDTRMNSGVRKLIKQYMPQYRYDTFINRLFGRRWSNLTEYPYDSLEKAKQIIENDKLKDEVDQNRMIKYINVD